MNRFEFALRENNTGSFPRGMALMFRTLRGWLHGGDPFEALTYEQAARRAEGAARPGERVFEDADPQHLVGNRAPHDGAA